MSKVAAVTALTLFKTAQVIEYVRGAVQSIPEGQTEAAMAIGLTFREGWQPTETQARFLTFLREASPANGYSQTE